MSGEFEFFIWITFMFMVRAIGRVADAIKELAHEVRKSRKTVPPQT